ncbi:hypothetical protein [Embleya hyalina]|uniref:Uncharacterized protein n=1 Tax=Embleya hyalina TaxID=516124 RepID=A0A401YVJ6_9ACTN|nr:hypothetical protein [Embleya hyalina]GCD98565.1 hypothetical protein EHYA_06276 [Embleya hyalina]
MNRRRDRGEPLRSGTPEHAALETELRDWMGRRADAVTPATLRAREVPLPAAPVRRLRVPLRPAALVGAIVVAAAGWMVFGSTSTPDGPRPVTVPPAVPAPPTGAPVESAPSTGAPTPSTAGTAPPRATGSDSPTAPETIPGPDSGGRRTAPPENQPPRTAPPSVPAGGRRTG